MSHVHMVCGVCSSCVGQEAEGSARSEDRLVEIKSSFKGVDKVLANDGLAVQLTCNGSKSVSSLLPLASRTDTSLACIHGAEIPTKKLYIKY